jgi:hypothetical protein
MIPVLSLLALVACNTAPTDYRVAKVPGAKAPYAGPTDDACVERGVLDTEIDGFYFCGEDEGRTKIPVDDPIVVACRDVDPDDRQVVSVFDGVTARAYPTELLLGRELVNDQWGDEPLLIDF